MRLKECRDGGHQKGCAEISAVLEACEARAGRKLDMQYNRKARV